MDRGPFDYPMSHYIGFWIIGAIGSLVSRLQNITADPAPVTCWFCVIMRIVAITMTGGLAGVLTFWTGEALHVPLHFTAAAAGIVGHMGVKSFEIGENLIFLVIEKMKRSIDPTYSDHHDSSDDPK